MRKEARAIMPAKHKMAVRIARNKALFFNSRVQNGSLLDVT
jgi:hypothetical protein